ncbi:MAG: hypothetical protein KC656_27050, partial [Myxococcales bacterium]|nr:hypothetical protein [Myxococcales bacterium]
MIPDSLLSGDNASFLDEAWARWREDPASVDPELQEVFASLEGPTNGVRIGGGPSFRPRSIFDAAGGGGVDAGVMRDVARRQAATAQIINAYRVRGHFEARIDPLQRRELKVHEELHHTYYGLTDADLDEEVDTAPLFGVPPRATLR